LSESSAGPPSISSRQGAFLRLEIILATRLSKKDVPVSGNAATTAHDTAVGPAVQKFDSGAVRGTDLAGQRYSLIPPFAYRIIMDLDGAVTLTDGGEARIAVKNLVTQLGRLVHSLEPRATIDDLVEIAAKVVMFPSASPNEALRRLATVCANGEKKYTAFNWCKGFPVTSLIDHAIKHYLTWLEETNSGEDDLTHALWNICVIHHFHSLGKAHHFDTRDP
jgi:hypothetical protein